MVEAFVFGVSFLVCLGLGLSIVVAGLLMAATDARVYEAQRQADRAVAEAGQRVVGDVLLTSVGLVLTASGVTGLLAMIGVL
jgi:hypothetical protein